MKDIDCKLCPLHKYRTKIVWGQIPLEKWNGIVLVGEAPGEEEDKTGQPFVGKAGDKLDECLKMAGIIRSELYIYNILKCRPPKNNIGHADSVEGLKICPGTYLIPELEDLHKSGRFKLVIALGGTAIKILLGQDEVLKIKGRIWESPEGFPPLLTTVHPSYIMRGNPDKLLVEDLIKAREFADAD